MVVSRIVAWLPDRMRDGIADRDRRRLDPVDTGLPGNVIANLAQVLGPETPRPELEAMARQIFRMSARNFGELLRLQHLSPDATDRACADLGQGSGRLAATPASAVRESSSPPRTWAPST